MAFLNSFYVIGLSMNLSFCRNVRRFSTVLSLVLLESSTLEKCGPNTLIFSLTFVAINPLTGLRMAMLMVD